MTSPTAENQQTTSPWMTRHEAALYLALSVDTIDRRKIAWTEKPPRKPLLRYKTLLGENGKQWPRLWREDVINNSFQSVPQSRPNAQRL